MSSSSFSTTGIVESSSSESPYLLHPLGNPSDLITPVFYMEINFLNGIPILDSLQAKDWVHKLNDRLTYI